MRPHPRSHRNAGKTPWRRGLTVARLAFMPAIVCGINDSPGALEALRVARTMLAIGQVDCGKPRLAMAAGGGVKRITGLAAWKTRGWPLTTTSMKLPPPPPPTRPVSSPAERALAWAWT